MRNLENSSQERDKHLYGFNASMHGRNKTTCDPDKALTESNAFMQGFNKDSIPFNEFMHDLYKDSATLYEMTHHPVDALIDFDEALHNLVKTLYNPA